MVNKNNFFLCVFGPDGSGKSTVYSELVKIYNPDKISHFHWRPGLFPYKSKKSKGFVSAFNNPHQVKTKSLIKSFLILLYIYLDFVFGYFFKVKNKYREIIYYERYFYDLIVDQKRYGIKVNPSIINFFSYFVKKPDLIIILDADSKILIERKQELSLKEIERQRILYKNSITKFSKSLIINVENKTPKEVVEIILKTIKKNCE
tara:strand:- start:4134 stop:4745 length:612 start_codon:yes stop_codon:yes gene_type:complete